MLQYPKKRRKRSQISVDFIIMLAIILIVFLIIFDIAEKRTAELDSIKTLLYAKQEAESLANDINRVFLGGDGSMATTLLTGVFKDNTPYIINIYPGAHLIEIRWNSTGGSKHYDAPLLTSYLDGQLVNISQTVNISNINGLVIIGPSILGTCNDFCFNRGYSLGTCRQSTRRCNQNEEVHESLGDRYCTQRRVRDTCCCKP